MAPVCYTGCMNAEEMWRSARGYLTQGAAPYTAWAFFGKTGEQTDRLAFLAAQGIKRATTSLYADYKESGDPIPVAGDYSVVLDAKGEAVCVIVDEKVSVVPFGTVDEAYAAKEGEGGTSLAFWREAHRQAFPGVKDDDLVVCEEFRKVYP